jgi:hypothetical protein
MLGFVEEIEETVEVLIPTISPGYTDLISPRIPR